MMRVFSRDRYERSDKNISRESNSKSGRRRSIQRIYGIDDIIDNIKSSTSLVELIYATQALSYYFGLTPNEFWSLTYKEVNTFCQSNLIKMQDDFKRNIVLQEAVTDKMIQADSMSRRPKIVPLRKMFKELF